MKNRQKHKARWGLLWIHCRKSPGTFFAVFILLYGVGIPLLRNIAVSYADLYERSMEMYGKAAIIAVLAQIIILFAAFNPVYSAGMEELLYMEPVWSECLITGDIYLLQQVMLLPYYVILGMSCKGYAFLFSGMILQLMVISVLFYGLKQLTGNPLITVVVTLVFMFLNIATGNNGEFYVLVKTKPVFTDYSVAYFIFHLCCMTVMCFIGIVFEHSFRKR